MPCSSVALCLCVDGRHVAQAAVKAAHLEENTLLWAGGELAPCSSLELLGQAEPWNRRDEVFNVLVESGGIRSDPSDSWAAGKNTLTCRASVARRHVEAIVLMGRVGVRISRDVDAADRLLHPVGVSKMEAALKAALIF